MNITVASHEIRSMNFHFTTMDSINCNGKKETLNEIYIFTAFIKKLMSTKIS